jgi:hypothetical protein
MSSINYKNKKYLCKCNYCLNKQKEGCWLLKKTCDSHLRRQRYFQQINSEINEYINPLLDSNSSYENNK